MRDTWNWPQNKTQLRSHHDKYTCHVQLRTWVLLRFLHTATSWQGMLLLNYLSTWDKPQDFVWSWWDDSGQVWEEPFKLWCGFVFSFSAFFDIAGFFNISPNYTEMQNALLVLSVGRLLWCMWGLFALKLRVLRQSFHHISSEERSNHKELSLLYIIYLSIQIKLKVNQELTVTSLYISHFENSICFYCVCHWFVFYWYEIEIIASMWQLHCGKK